MKLYPLLLASAVVLALAPEISIGQANAPAAPAAPASAATPAGKLGPRLLTPAEKRDSASPAGDLRPERPVTPQISIPLGKKPPSPPAKEESRAVRPGNAASAGVVDDAVARCEAQRGEQVRAKCRDELAREARNRTPA